MDLDDGTVQGDGFELHAEDLRVLQLGKDAIQHPALCSTIHARIDGVPVAEPRGSPRHLHPCSATYKMALRTCRLSSVTWPRSVGKHGAMWRYCASVISMSGVSHEKMAVSVNTP